MGIREKGRGKKDKKATALTNMKIVCWLINRGENKPKMPSYHASSEQENCKYSSGGILRTRRHRSSSSLDHEAVLRVTGSVWLESLVRHQHRAARGAGDIVGLGHHKVRMFLRDLVAVRKHRRAVREPRERSRYGKVIRLLWVIPPTAGMPALC